MAGLTPLAPTLGYLQHWLAHSEQDLQQRGTGTTFKQVSKSDLRDFPLRLAPLNEQRRIVAKLDALQSHSRKARAALDAIPTLLDRFRQSVLAAAFRGDLTAEWRAAHPDVEPASALLARIRVERKRRWIADYIDTMTDRARKRAEKKGKPWTDADAAKARKGYAKKAAEKYQEPAPVDGEADDLLSLPQGWSWVPIEAVGDIRNGRQRAKPQPGMPTRPYLRIANIQDDQIDFTDVNDMAFGEDTAVTYALQPGDILVSAGQALGKVGQSAMYTSDMPNVGFQKNLFRFRAFQPHVLPAYAQLVFRAWVRLGFFMRRSSITTNLAYMTTGRFARCPFPLPPLAEQVRIVAAAVAAMDVAGTVEGLADSTKASVQRLDQSILSKAFRGELVPQDPTDEPAADLLARIQKERKGSGRR